MKVTVLHFGLNKVVEIPVSSEALRAVFSHPRGACEQDVAATVQQAIEQPLEFPPLVMAAVPGDRIVFAIDQAVPQRTNVLAALIQAFIEHGSAPEELSILQTESLAGSHTPDPRMGLPPELQTKVEWLRHDPANADQHCHLLNLENGDEVRIHRALFDADVIVPVGLLRAQANSNANTVFDCLFPALADEATQQRFQEANLARAYSKKRSLAVLAEVAHSLGLFLTVQIVPGPGDEIMHILAGDPAAVFKRGQELCDQAWTIEVEEPVDLVVLGLAGDEAQQDWAKLSRAIQNALPLVAEGGALAICTQLAIQPGPAMQQLVGADDATDVLKRIRKRNFADASIAATVANALEQVKIYLLSRLPEEVVEDLGLAHVETSSEIVRLAQHAASCVIISNAQYALGKLIVTDRAT